MHNTLPRLLIAAFLASALVAGAPSAWALRGDHEAIAMARRMIEHMGGREAWARARWVYAREEAHFSTRASPADAQYWRRLDRPGGRWRVRAPGYARDVVWDNERGARSLNGVRSAFSAAELQQETGWWHGDIYTMYGRLAREDENLRLERSSERSFTVLNASDGAFLGEFFVDHNGALARWRFGFGRQAVDYVYGPPRAFGDISAPSWGALSDGSFRFSYTDFRLAAHDEEARFAGED